MRSPCWFGQGNVTQGWAWLQLAAGLASGRCAAGGIVPDGLQLEIEIQPRVALAVLFVEPHFVGQAVAGGIGKGVPQVFFP